MQQAAKVDGRRKRSETSRNRIVDALMALVQEGHAAPAAEQVAERAGIGLRSVFRHFSDMDSLYVEICGRIAAGLEASARQPFIAQDWCGQLLEMIDRRAFAYEMIAPFQRAAEAHRHRSPALRESHVRLVATLRGLLVGRLPLEVAAQAPLVEALDALLSFETWNRLREHQRLGVAEARGVLVHALGRLIADAPGTT